VSDTLVTFTVFGPPATKGSTVSFLSSEGKVITRTDSNGLRSWSESVGWAAREARVPLLNKPKAVLVSVRFEFICPPSAVLDSLTKIAYDDDAQVIEVRALKVYGTRELTVFGIAPVTLV
jgi:Holliday junction resolvase RusA-like endonuclease